MASLMGLEALSLFLLSFCAVINADTPVNCTAEDVRGSWLFLVGQGGYNNTINCLLDFNVVAGFQVDLLYPDIAIDGDGNEGFWSMVCNQGFEVVIKGRKYFAFNAFEKRGAVVFSFCDKTRNGWSHDAAEYRPGNWACYKGRKLSKVQEKEEKLNLLTAVENTNYIQNQAFIDQINNAQNSWQAGAYDEDFWQTMYRVKGQTRFTLPIATQVTEEDLLAAESLPEEFDWRNVSGKNYVSPVRSQKTCGSCYAFASLSMFEARVRILSNDTKTPLFSPQDIVSCSEYNQGCSGGYPYLVGKYAEDFGLVDEQCFPYKAQDSPCHKRNCTRHYGTGYHYIGGYLGACNEVRMRIELVNNGPIAVSMATYRDFSNYKSGIYHVTGWAKKFKVVLHAVLIVGYGTDKKTGEKFWIVKNSWGKAFGEKGFFRIRRGTDECSIEGGAVAAEPVMIN